MVSHDTFGGNFHNQCLINCHSHKNIMSKGSDPRPMKVDKKTFENNWDKIFKKNVKETKNFKKTSSR